MTVTITTTLKNFTEDEFYTQLAGFLKAANNKVKEYYKTDADLLDWTEGKRYIRVASNPSGSRYVYCFIDKTNGNVLKAAGWKQPELRNPRSNIFDEDFGASGVNWHGAIYLRR